jgi:hypothetical protein
MDRPALKEFKEVLSDFHQLAALALKGAVAAPLTDLWLRLGPLPTKPVAVLSSFVEFLVVIWVFQFLRSSKPQRLKLGMNVSILVFMAGICASLIMLSMFTVSPGKDRERVLEGFILREDVKPVITNSFTPEDALRASQYDAEKVWTKQSIVAIQACIILCWVAAFSATAWYLTTFIILQRRQT